MDRPDKRPKYVVTLTGPMHPDRLRILRVLRLLTEPNEWDGPPPRIEIAIKQHTPEQSQ